MFLVWFYDESFDFYNEPRQDFRLLLLIPVTVLFPFLFLKFKERIVSNFFYSIIK